eukprot:GHVP01022791.1.p1 GENE.GHVP01022791.1~~GHVP01022791.1.p1  ORF type:complete len:2740 (+),score=457.13 GHVP01022791.1:18-8237(+)
MLLRILLPFFWAKSLDAQTIRGRGILDRGNNNPSGGGSVVPPRNGYDMVCEDNPLVEATGTKCRLLAVSLGGLGCNQKLIDLVIARGSDPEVIPPAFRDRRVADACPESCGLCELCAPGCAFWFVGNGLCEPACDTPACQNDGGDCWDKNCVLSDWSDWGPCSVECDDVGYGGVEVRTREIEVEPTAGGRPCEKLSEEKPGCNKDVKCPVRCELSPWEEWSECSVKCGTGLEKRTRQIIQEPLFNAPPCGELEQTRPCQRPLCTTDCVVSEWSEWEICWPPCKGSKIRTRNILTQPTIDGLECGPLVEEESCIDVDACEATENKCVYSAWGIWEDCSTLCDGGTTSRRRELLNADQVKNSSKCLDLLEERPCNEAPCPDDCVVGDWERWSECSVECGQGISTRIRSVLVQPRGLGTPCPALLQERPCVMQQCEEECLVGSWTEWSNCQLGPGAECGPGLQFRSRVLLVQDDSSFGQCPELKESKECSVSCGTKCSDPNFICSSRCQFSGWGPWSQCDSPCGLGTKTRTRVLLVAPEGDPEGTTCGPTAEFAPCLGPQGSCPRNCVLSKWTTDPTCDATCGEGYFKRTRPVVVKPIGQGTGCGDLWEYLLCPNLPSCSSNLSCLYSEWSPYGECSISCQETGDGYKLRERSIIKFGPGSREDCRFFWEYTSCSESLPEICPVDCVPGSWGEIGECSPECGIGKKIQSREVELPSKGTGNECSNLSRELPCFNQPCHTECELSEWSDWSECTDECGGGTRNRKRTVVVPPSSKAFPCSDLWEFELCNDFSCDEEKENPADCKVTEWSTWSDCPVSCGGGVQSRTRTVESPQKLGGKECPALTEDRGCGLSRCPGAPCQDTKLLEQNGVTCSIVVGGGCNTILKKLAEESGVVFPPNFPPETRVLDACPVTCDVCQECAEDCQLRDRGNSVCDEKCNNAECLFDLGDCGNDCTLPEVLVGRSDLTITPPSSGIDVDMEMKLACSNSFEVFLNYPQIPVLTVQCVENSDEEKFKLFPESVFPSWLSLDVAAKNFNCGSDPCAQIILTGFPIDFGSINGLYRRRFELEDGSYALFPFYSQDAESPQYDEDLGPWLLWGDSKARNQNRFAWTLTSYEPVDIFETEVPGRYVATASSESCEAPLKAKDSPLDCLEESSWTIAEAKQFAFPELTVPAGQVKVGCATNSEAIDFLRGDKEVPVSYLLVNGELQEFYCEDQDLLEEMNDRSCQELVGFCDLDLHTIGGDLVPDWIPKSMKVRQICATTCNFCEECSTGCPMAFINNSYCDSACENDACDLDGADCGLQSSTTEAPGGDCDDNPMVVDIGYSCMQLKAVADSASTGCSATLVEIAESVGQTIELPPDIPPTTTLSEACPKTCGSCAASSTIPIGCQDNADLSAVISCASLVGQAPNGCDSPLSEVRSFPPSLDFDQNQRLGALCKNTCNECSAGSAMKSVCTNSDEFESKSPYQCSEIVAMVGNCTLLVSSLTNDAELIEMLPEGTEVRHVCPVACGLCPPGELCEDSQEALDEIDSTCSVLEALGCDTLLSSFPSSEVLKAPELTRVRDLCRKSCRFCDDGNPVGGPPCVDDPFIFQSGIRCETLIQLALDGCASPLTDHISADMFPIRIDSSAKIIDVCPFSCKDCADEDGSECSDSRLVTEMETTCATLIQFGTLGCSTLISQFGEISGAPENFRVYDVCGKSCLRCGATPTCLDGFQNGDETGPDCGGSCRTCRSCTPASLKLLGEAYLIEGSGLKHGSKRTLSCNTDGGYEQINKVAELEEIECVDGTFSPGLLRCVKKRVMLEKGHFELVGAEGLDHKSISSLHGAAISALSVRLPNEIRISKVGSCAELSGVVCEDNPDVEQTGYTCDVLAQAGCSVLLSALAAQGGKSLPENIPANSTVGEACPRTCRICLDESSSPGDSYSSQPCLRANFFLDWKEEATKLDLALNSPDLQSRFLAALSNLFSLRNIQSRVFDPKLNAEVVSSASMVIEMNPVSVVFSPVTETLIAESDWIDAFKTGDNDQFAKSIFTSPGAGIPLVDVSDIFNGLGPEPPTIGADKTTTEYKNWLIKAADTWAKQGFVPVEIRGEVRADEQKLQVSPVIRTVAGKCVDTEEQDNENSCCHMKRDFQKFLDSACGKLIYGRRITNNDMRDFCLGVAPLGLPQSFGLENYHSCYSVGISILESYSTRTGPACSLFDSTQKLIQSWCSTGVEVKPDSTGRRLQVSDNEYCFVGVDETIDKLDLRILTTLPADQLEELCESSCFRRQLEYLDARVQIELGWATAYGPRETTDFSSGASRALSVSLAGSNKLKEFGTTVSQMIRTSTNKITNNANNNHSITGRSLLLGREFNSALGDSPLDILNLVCFKADGNLCTDSLLILSEEDPVKNPLLVQDPCEVSCFVPLTGYLGSMLEAYGRRVGSPYDAALGAVMRAYGRYYCIKNDRERYCSNFIFATLLTLEVPETEPEGLTGIGPIDNCTCPLGFLQDGHCDKECFNKDCFWDGNDCRIHRMLPELYFALLSVFEEQISPTFQFDYRQPCSIFDTAFSCNLIPYGQKSTCIERIKVAGTVQGCCLSAAIEILGKLVEIEASNPLLEYEDIWKPERTIAYLEQECNLSLDRTCSHRLPRTIFKAEVEIENIDYAQLSKDEKSRKKLMEEVVVTFTQIFEIFDADIVRMTVGETMSGIVTELTVDPGDENAKAALNLIDGKLTEVEKTLSRRLLGSPVVEDLLINSPNRYSRICSL